MHSRRDKRKTNRISLSYLLESDWENRLADKEGKSLPNRYTALPREINFDNAIKGERYEKERKELAHR